MYLTGLPQQNNQHQHQHTGSGNQTKFFGAFLVFPIFVSLLVQGCFYFAVNAAVVGESVGPGMINGDFTKLLIEKNAVGFGFLHVEVNSNHTVITMNDHVVARFAVEKT